MTIEKREITIPSWVISAIIPIIITVAGYTVGITRINVRAETDIANIKINVERLDKDKANKEMVDVIYETLKRVELKIDNIEKKKD